MALARQLLHLGPAGVGAAPRSGRTCLWHFPRRCPASRRRCGSAPGAAPAPGSWPRSRRSPPDRVAPDCHLPTSMWATQWLTPTSGRQKRKERARAAVATVRRHGPRPGPWEKAMASIFNPCSAGLAQHLAHHLGHVLGMVLGRLARMDAALWPACRWRSSHRSRPASSTRAALRFQAVPSSPNTII